MDSAFWLYMCRFAMDLELSKYMYIIHVTNESVSTWTNKRNSWVKMNRGNSLYSLYIDQIYYVLHSYL